ncbi:hypothetical protein PPERSA_08116 [Pseudocohnilembus persalinus]|uniref:RING-type domain-containing protein n=1 Tax=Pseudocohnilembus persalinus TaxID=266149 RepID=A0A0V0QLV1_PSEPJ|nr:hypothetical protein PPERSA_08116 [Pseudocohnilembus persalinus]|eukprot:KRX03041.1 hypothetical protein PPERSA_08116 [Pseudocohnilembus persalinus]
MGKQVISNKDLLYNNINSDREPVKTRFQKKAQLCGICYCNIEEQGLLNSCRHEFCFSCINRWSKKENTCPICKRRFINIKRKWKRKCYAKLFREFKKRQQNNIKVKYSTCCLQIMIQDKVQAKKILMIIFELKQKLIKDKCKELCPWK